MLLVVDSTKNMVKFRPPLLGFQNAEVAELADALGSGLSGHYARVGSSPTFGTGTLPAPSCRVFISLA